MGFLQEIIRFYGLTKSSLLGSLEDVGPPRNIRFYGLSQEIHRLSLEHPVMAERKYKNKRMSEELSQDRGGRVPGSIPGT